MYQLEINNAPLQCFTTHWFLQTDESQYRGGRKASRGYSDPQSGSISSPINGPNTNTNTLAIEGPIRLTSLPSAALLPLEDNELNQFSEVSQFSDQGASDSIPYEGRDRRMSSSRSEVETDDKSLHSEICLFCRKVRQRKLGGDEDMDGKKS